MPLVGEVTIQNYKSIRKLALDLGRVNVLIGANGSGKSNILEAIAYGAAGAQNKLDNEYLAPRGIRVVEPRFMRCAFPEAEAGSPIAISFQLRGREKTHVHIDPERRSLVEPLPTQVLPNSEAFEQVVESVLRAAREDLRERYPEFPRNRLLEVVRSIIKSNIEEMLPPSFLVYAPENSALRVFQAEPQILPLGIKGEGLFAHLKALSAPEHAERLAAIGDRLALLDWFERIEIPKDLAPGERSLLIRDRYLAEGALFDQRSANEGFLFLLFYMTLFISDATPSFFAIDNVDSSLNPKLVTTLVGQLVELAKEHDKQVIFTTHNPAVLDGIDLSDDEQRLFVTERGKDGSTRIRRVSPPKPLEGDAPLALSEAFLRGYLGGLPKNF